jgi:predicted O-methyltransferase YrrM
MTSELAVVSGADANFFPLLRGLVGSLRDLDEGRGADLHIFDIGLTEPQRRWLLVQGARLHRLPDAAPGRVNLPAHFRLLLLRCRIPELLPGHQIYLWIDADAWVQRWEAIEAYAAGARRAGFAIVAETDPAYDRRILQLAHAPSFAAFGAEASERLSRAGSRNAGVFAGRAGAPHWQAWRRRLEPKIAETGDPGLLFLLDQTALSLVCTDGDLPVAELPATANWVANLALPMIADDGRELVRPLPPHEPLGIVHQAGHTKRGFFALRRPAGGAMSRPLGYQARSQLAADDYVSPGLRIILTDECFPNLVRRDPATAISAVPRPGVPHALLADRRLPEKAFLNRDEAHILYNLALGFCGRAALQIGCAMGWSSCHLAAAGVDLDVIDLLLANRDVRNSVQNSLQACRFAGRVVLAAGHSPEAVRELAGNRPGGWSLFLIEGDDGDAALHHVRACEPCAAADAAMLFHNLASPSVAAAVAYLRDRAWHIRVYHTAGIMAVAWRGDVRPVAHCPDPRVDWPIPEHVMPLLLPPAVAAGIAVPQTEGPPSDADRSVLHAIDLPKQAASVNEAALLGRTPLCDLMTAAGSDKGYPGRHNYTVMYDRLLAQFRREQLAIFELGVGTNKPGASSTMGPGGTPGASLRAWAGYFPNARIYGADIDRDILFAADRIRTFWVDQRDPAAIRGLWNEVASVAFDIIIDDGLHQADANIRFLRESFHRLKPGGIYVIEDIVPNDEPIVSDFVRSLAASCRSALCCALPHPYNDFDNRLAILHKA